MVGNSISKGKIQQILKSDDRTQDDYRSGNVDSSTCSDTQHSTLSQFPVNALFVIGSIRGVDELLA